MKEELLETEHAKSLIRKLKNHHPSHGNIIDLLGSMENVEIFLEWIKPTASPALFKAMQFVLGMGEQEGLTAEVEGIGLVDKSISTLVKRLNELGYRTLASCSGLQEDHPLKQEALKGYLSFRSNQVTDDVIKSVAKQVGIVVEEGTTYFEPSVTIRVIGKTESEKEDKWKAFLKKIEEKEGVNA